MLSNCSNYNLNFTLNLTPQRFDDLIAVLGKATDGDGNLGAGYDVVFNSIDALICCLDTDCNILRANEAFSEFFIKKDQKFAGRNLADVFPELSRVFGDDIQKVLNTGEAGRDLSKNIISPSGQEQYFKVQILPLTNSAGLLGGVALLAVAIDGGGAGFTQDEVGVQVTPCLTSLLDNLPGIAYRCLNDEDYTLEYISEGCRDLTGYDVDDLLFNKRQSLGKIIHPEDLPKVRSGVQEALDEHRFFHLEYRLISADGEVKWVWEKGVGVFDSDNNLEALEGLIIDITDRKKVEEALTESESRYRLFMDNFQGITFRTGENFEPIFVHGATEEITGYTEEDFLGGKIKWINLIHPDDLDLFSERIVNLEQNGGSCQWEYRIIRKDGGVCWIREMCQKKTCDDDERDIRQGVIYDITDSKSIKAELSEYRENMVRADHLASLGTMGATFAHQLNQPLTVIRLLLQQSLRAMDKSNDKQVRANINDSLAEVTNSIGIINQYLAFSSRRSEKELQQVNIADIVSKIMRVLAEVALKANMDLKMENIYSLPTIEGYVGEIEQIIFILIQNAIQAAKGKKKCKLTVSGKSFEDKIELKFADTCCGIADEDLAKIFEPFFTTKPPSEGTGLGLCILRQMISKHGGKVKVESKVGVGTTFTITLPITF